MRINVYSQELTKELSIVSQRARDTGITYHGIRIFLASPEILHHTAEDDDRSAITLWVPKCKSFTNIDLGDLLARAAALAYSLKIQ